MNSDQPESPSTLILTTGMSAPDSLPSWSPKLFHTLGQQAILFERHHVYLLSTLDEIIQRFDINQILKYGFNDSNQSFSFTYLFHAGHTKQFRFKSPLYRDIFDTLNEVIQEAVKNPVLTKDSQTPSFSIPQPHSPPLLSRKPSKIKLSHRHSATFFFGRESTSKSTMSHDGQFPSLQRQQPLNSWGLQKSKSHAQLSTRHTASQPASDNSIPDKERFGNMGQTDGTRIKAKKSFAKLKSFGSNFLNLFRHQQHHTENIHAQPTNARSIATIDRKLGTPSDMQIKDKELSPSILKLEGPVTIYGTEDAHVLIKLFHGDEQIVSAGTLKALIDCIYKQPQLLLKLRESFLQLRSLAKRKKAFKFSDTPEQLPLVLMHRIVSCLKKWMATQPFDFLNPNLLPHFYGFQAEIESFFGAAYFEAIKSSFERLVRDGPLLHETLDIQQAPNKDVGDYEFLVEEVKYMMSSSAMAIAQALTLVDYELAQRIQPHEFIFYLLSQGEHVEDSSQGNASQCTHLVDFIHRFNRIGFWVASVILSMDSLRARTAVVSKMIRIAQFCVLFGNFNTALAIVSGLNNSAVLRLKSTFANLSPNVTNMLKEIEYYFDFQGNYRAYREMEEQAKTPHIPFFGLIVKDLYSLNESIPKLTSGGLINFDRSWKIHDIVQRYMACLVGSFNFASPAVDLGRWSLSGIRGRTSSDESVSHSESNLEALGDYETVVDDDSTKVLSRSSLLLEGRNSNEVRKLSSDTAAHSRSSVNSYYYVLPYLSQKALTARSHHIEPAAGSIASKSPLSSSVEIGEDSQSAITTIPEEQDNDAHENQNQKHYPEDSTGFMTHALSRLGSSLEEVMASLGNASKRFREMAEFSGHHSTSGLNGLTRPSSRIFRKASQSKRLSATMFRQLSLPSMSSLFHVNSGTISPSLVSATTCNSLAKPEDSNLPPSPETPLTACEDNAALETLVSPSQTNLTVREDKPKVERVKMTIGTQTPEFVENTIMTGVALPRNTGPVGGLLDVLDDALLAAAKPLSHVQAAVPVDDVSPHS